MRCGMTAWARAISNWINLDSACIGVRDSAVWRVCPPQAGAPLNIAAKWASP